MNTDVKETLGICFLELLGEFDTFMSERFVKGVNYDATVEVAKQWKKVLATSHFAESFALWYGKLPNDREDEWSFSVKEKAIRSLFPKTVSVIEDYGNENCHRLASARTFDTEIGVVYQRYPGDRDSFGWLVGVEKLSFRIDETRSFRLISSWG